MNDLRAACAAQTQQLVQWAAATELAAIPDAALKAAVRVLADDLAAMIGARDEPEVAAFHARTIERSRHAEATLFRDGAPRVDRISAAVANAMATDWLELDEGYRVTACHGGLYTVPTLLAQAEANALRFDEMLRALVLGYEIVTRVARAWSSPVLTMQCHGRYCAVGAAAAAALAARVDAATLMAALTNAATLIGPSPRNHMYEGALVRNVWPAAGAWSGLMALEWAQCGISGLPGGLFDVYSSVLGGQAHPQRLTDGLGEHWAVLDGYTKIHACCQLLHASVDAAVELHQALHADQVPLAQIESIHVETHGLALPLGNAQPQTTLAAKFSLPHAVAAVLVVGDSGAEAFGTPSLRNEAIGRLRTRVSMAPFEPAPPPPHDRPARVSVTLADGRRLQAECLSAIGSPDRPAPAGAVQDKLRTLAAPAFARIVPVFEELGELDAGVRARRWPQVVQSFL